VGAWTACSLLPLSFASLLAKGEGVVKPLVH
jgi:hypothetical protein